MLFEDSSGLRRGICVAFLAMCAAASVIWAGDHLYRTATLPSLAQLPGTGLRGGAAQDRPQTPQSWTETRLLPETPADCSAHEAPARDVWGYVPRNNQRAVAAVAGHCSQLTGVIVDALTFGGRISAAALSRLQLPLELPAPDLTTYLTIRPAAGLPDAEIEAVLEGFPAVRAVSGAGQEYAVEAAAGFGVCLDLSGKDSVPPAAVSRFLTKLPGALGRPLQGKCLIAGPEAHVWDDPDLVASLDVAVMAAFSASSETFGALAPAAWYRDVLLPAAARLPREKRVVALGAFGELWKSGQAQRKQVSFAEAMWLASANEAEIAFPELQGNTRIQFIDQNRRLNKIWMLDAGSFHNQLTALPADQPVAVWPLGSEDPAIWPLLAHEGSAQDAARLIGRQVQLQETVLKTGGTSFLGSVEAPVHGQRGVETDADGLVTDIHYERPPRPALLHGAGMTAGGPAIVVTFNGMAEGDVRDKVFAALRGNGVRAAVFLTWFDALKQGRALRQFAGQGHTIGAHRVPAKGKAFSGEAASAYFDRQTQHAFQHLTGKRAALLRQSSGDLTSPATLAALQTSSGMLGEGYLPAAPGIEWHGDPAKKEEFLDQVYAAAMTRPVVVVTFDMTGAHASHIADELPDLLAKLGRDGFQFEDYSGVSGWDAAAFTPPSASTAPVRDAVNYGLFQFWLFGLTAVFLVLLCIAATRSLTHLTLAFLRKPAPGIDPEFTPGVTIVVPAYNEAKVIVPSVRSILESDYPNLEVLVIDDGSTDGTAEAVKKAFSGHPRVRLLEQENGGKWRAENTALKYVKTPIFVGVDADTVLAPDAITHLVQPFRTGNVGAVAGFVEVGNRGGFLTSCQALEYNVSQSVTRRAFETFNGIFVVPGAIGAWRVDAVKAAGKYSGDTITEDADLTVAMHRAGFKVKFQEHARAYTEAPTEVAPFMKQRLRWTLGMLQTSWKHRGSIREGRAIGLVSIIDAIWFNILTCLLAPLVDILLFAILAKALYLFASQGAEGLSGFPLAILGSYLLLMALDVINTLAAFWFERKFDLKLLLLTPILRFGYRQLLYMALLKAVWVALTGRLPGWEKLERTAECLLPHAAGQAEALVFASVRSCGTPSFVSSRTGGPGRPPKKNAPG
jgi:cellulose synthase/poly-beta-1,6-N-acetylglucosamine synthase-like glycosyltransferase